MKMKMVQKGREKIAYKSKEDRSEQTQADHELFLQAFEKPTQIYRYLRTRNLISPIFLNRTLTYMKKRMSRTNEARKTFKVDTLLERRQKEDSDMSVTNLGGFMTMTFLGYYDKTGLKESRVRLELVLVKLSHKKRKESAGPVVQVISLGTSEVPVNPSEDNPPSKAPALSIPSKSFSLSGFSGVGRVKTYSLVVRVHCDESDENSEPARKKRKGLEPEETEPNGRVVQAELVVYDKHSRCLLTEGEYELVMAESEGRARKSPQSTASWEIIDLEPGSSAAQFQVFSQSPTLKFRLSWSSEQAGPMVERPRPLMPRDNAQDSTYLRCDKSQGSGRSPRSELGGPVPVQPSNASVTSVTSNGCTLPTTPTKENNQAPGHNIGGGPHGTQNGTSNGNSEKPTRIVYQFLYNNNSRQQTEAREDLHCPWCSLNCLELLSLLKHLKLSHPRFLFTYVPIPEGARVDVSVSELYDSTYVGNPHDMIGQPPGFAFSRNGPVQRTSITNILVFKPARTADSLSEFLELDNDEHGGSSVERPFVSGHNRLYHYSTTCLPIPPHAILSGEEIEDQTDPGWLKIKTSKMIDDFTDVNSGEKDFMKMWNLHIQHFTFVGDCQMPQALAIFLETRGQEVIQKNLFRNFCLHLVNLFEFGIIGPAHVFTAISRLQSMVRSLGLQHDLSWGGLLTSQSPRLSAQSPNSRKSAKFRKNFAGIFSKCGANSQ